MTMPMNTTIPEGGAKPEPPAEPAFAKALREQLRDMADKPLTVKSARQIGMFASASAKLMKIVGRGPLPSGKRHYGGYMGPLGNMDDELDDEGGGMSVVPLSPLSSLGNAETFGSNVVRQALAAYKEIEENKKRSPIQLIRAIGEAKRAGLDDIAEELKAKLRQFADLGVSLADPAPSPITGGCGGLMPGERCDGTCKHGTGCWHYQNPPQAEILRVDSKPDGSGEPQATEGPTQWIDGVGRMPVPSPLPGPVQPVTISDKPICAFDPECKDPTHTIRFGTGRPQRSARTKRLCKGCDIRGSGPPNTEWSHLYWLPGVGWCCVDCNNNGHWESHEVEEHALTEPQPAQPVAVSSPDMDPDDLTRIGESGSETEEF